MSLNGKRPLVRAIAIGVATVVEHFVGELIDLIIEWAKSRRGRKPKR